MKVISSISIYVLLALGIFPLALTAQHFDFSVGSGQVSLEPQRNVLSLSLAGYGGPRDGRFTLKWEDSGRLATGIDDVVFIDSKPFVLRSGDVWRIDNPAEGNKLKQLTFDSDITLLAAEGKRLYTVNNRGEILTATLGKKLKWRKIGLMADVDRPVALVIFGKDIIAADDQGGIWRSAQAGGNSSWARIGNLAGVIDLVVHSGRLYGLTDNNELAYFEPSGNWLRIAIKNDKNYRHDIHKVAVSNDVLHGFDASGSYYRGTHYSDGNLKAGAVFIKKGKERAILIGLDVCGFDADFVTGVKSELFLKYHIPASAILINASHTHYAPVTQRWTTWGEHCQRPDSLYLYTTVKEGILNSVRLAIKGAKDANLFFGRGTADIGRNRNLPGDNLPYDKDLDVIRIDYKNQQASDVLFLAGCHPVFNAKEEEFYKISANYPGTARELLAHHSAIRNPFFLQGCGGDINPVDADHNVTGKKVADAVIEVLEKDRMTRVHGDITCFLDTVSFPTRPWAKQDLLALKAEKEKLVGDIYAEERVRWANLMLSYYANGNMPSEMPVFIQTINIGNWKLVGVSRETTTEYSLAIKKLWPDQLVTIAGYCNDVSSYLPTSRHIKAKIYEGDDSFFWYSQPSSFPEQVHEVIIDSIKSKNR
ncbi:hypothetical protein GCM10007415_01630 [Parapedobacter pyrenivorans]|uniref:Uncharacterized protein n=1 Tax=Parapedobacter pyrenivorans TaxID=1305674 RepID=A0A917HBE8_9SPHI|nr:hypothetical protein [Parapedobacter pyrenivorans]GGG73912.1 hypothetical protein GCM10007415_01630 [Parapedobacter pyrenivorans]